MDKDGINVYRVALKGAKKAISWGEGSNSERSTRWEWTDTDGGIENDLGRYYYCLQRQWVGGKLTWVMNAGISLGSFASAGRGAPFDSAWWDMLKRRGERINYKTPGRWCFCCYMCLISSGELVNKVKKVEVAHCASLRPRNNIYLFAYISFSCEVAYCRFLPCIYHIAASTYVWQNAPPLHTGNLYKNQLWKLLESLYF